MSDLRQAVADDLAIRHALGFQLRSTRPRRCRPATCWPDRRVRPAPYLYNAAEIDATDALNPAMRAAISRTLLGLLAVTGMRVGEAIALDRDDVDLHERRLAIREAKHATRQLPLHPSTAEALRAYARRRDQLCPAPKARGVFLSTACTNLIYECVRATFSKLSRTAGLEQAARPSPRIHDLRRRFAMQTLRDWHRAGDDVAARLPLLLSFITSLGPRPTRARPAFCRRTSRTPAIS